MTDANLVSIRYTTENIANYGADPTGTPTMKEVPFSRESMELRTDNIRSPVIRSDRQTADQFRVSVREDGDIEGPVSYGVFDDWFQYGLYSPAWEAEVETIDAAAVTVTASSSTFAATGIATDVDVGDWVKVEGNATETGNNGWWKVATRPDANSFTVSGGTGTLADSTAACSVARGAYINAASTATEMFVEKEFGGLTGNKIVKMPGLFVRRLRVETSRRGFFNARFSFYGANEDRISATLGDGSPTPVNSNIVMNTVDHLVAVVNNSTVDLTQFSWELNNNLDPREVMGVFGPNSIGVGSIEITGDLQAYMDDTNAAFMDQYHDQDEVPFALIANDKSSTPYGNSYVFDIPAARFQTGRGNAEGIDTQVFARLTWGAKTSVEGTENRMMRIFKFAAS